MNLFKSVFTQVLTLVFLFLFTASINAQGFDSIVTDQVEEDERVEEASENSNTFVKEALVKSLENQENLTPTVIYSAQVNREEEGSSESTTSLTAGYINDEYIIITDSGSDRFIFDGEMAGAMISSEKASLLLGYGVADAENGGDIRSFLADASFGGNANIVSDLFGLPFSVYVPIRAKLGYRNLDLQQSDETMHVGDGGLGAGLGASIRIPTGIPALADNLVAFTSVVQSVGGMGQVSLDENSDPNAIYDGGMDGIRLTQNTDFNIEGKIERLLGENTGVTVGLTLRWQRWTDEAADNFWQVFDVATGNRDDLTLRGKQVFLRAGINW